MQTHIHMYIIHACIRTYTHTHNHIYTYTHTYTYIHTHTHTYAHTHAYTHIHTQIHVYINKYVLTNTMPMSVNGVDMLLKKHEDFVMTADAHDEKIKAL